MTFRDIDFEDLLKVLKRAGSPRRNVDRADYAMALRELGELYLEIDHNDVSEAVIALKPALLGDLVATEDQDAPAFASETPTPPWESGGSLINDETAVFQGTKYWDVHNASQAHSLQFHATYDHYRYEVRAGETWPYDGSSRSEVRDNVVRPNVTPIWGAYSFLVEYPPNESAAEWLVLGQMHDQTLTNNPTWAFEIDENGEDLIIVWRDGGAALEITTVRASSAWSADENGLYREYAPNQPRMELNLGLLVEEARTNWVRNPRCIGASLGDLAGLGSEPTNWTIGGKGTLTIICTGFGVQEGVGCNYIELEVTGTPSTSTLSLAPEPETQIVSSNGQVWAASVFLSVEAGALSGAIGLYIEEDTAAGAFIRNGPGTAFTPDNVMRRYAHIGTLAGGGTVARSRPKLIIAQTIGLPVSYRIRIGWWQHELGAFMTSPALPPVATVAATTRAADIITTTAPAYAGEATLFVEGVIAHNMLSVPTQHHWLADFVGAVAVDDEIGVRASAASNSFTANVANATVSQMVLSTGTQVPGQVFKLATAVKLNDGAFVANGGTPLTDAAMTMPATLTKLQIGSRANNTFIMNGYIRRVTYWPFRLSNATLQQITNPSFSDFFPEGATLDLRFERWGRYVAHRERLYRNLWYNIVFEFRADPAGVSSILGVWRNGEKVVDLAGENVPLGMPDTTGHYWKMGVYRDALTATDTLAVRYANTEMGSINLSGRILNPLPLTRERPVVIPPLDGTAPSLCASFRQRLLSTFTGVYYRLEEGSADQIDRLSDQSLNNWGAGIAGVGGTPTLVLTNDVSTANFLGDDSFTNFADMQDLFEADDFYFIVRFKCTSISTDELDSWDNDTIMGDAGRWVGICFRQPNFVLFHLDDNIAADARLEIPFTLDTWTTAEMYFDGAAFYGRVNGGAWTSQAVGGPITDMTAGWRLGRGLAGKFFRGEISDFAVYPTRLTDTLRDQIQTAIAAV